MPKASPRRKKPAPTATALGDCPVPRLAARSRGSHPLPEKARPHPPLPADRLLRSSAQLVCYPQAYAAGLGRTLPGWTVLGRPEGQDRSWSGGQAWPQAGASSATT